MLRADSSHIMTQIRTLLYGARCAVGAIAHRRLTSMRRLDAALPLAIGSMEALVPVPRMPCLTTNLPRVSLRGSLSETLGKFVAAASWQSSHDSSL